MFIIHITNYVFILSVFKYSSYPYLLLVILYAILVIVKVWNTIPYINICEITLSWTKIEIKINIINEIYAKI